MAGNSQPFPGVILDVFVIMPNHVHGIIHIDKYDGQSGVGATHESPLPLATHPPRPCGPKPQSIRAIIGSFKSAATKRIHAINGMSDIPIWQRNYYEHIIRDERDYQNILDYIETNPVNWEKDEVYTDL